MSGTFGSPLTLSGDGQSAPGFVLTSCNQAAAFDSGLIDVTQFESLVVNAATGIGAGNQVTVTFQWWDQGGSQIMGSSYFYTLTLDSGASSLNAVRIRNLGPYLRVITTASGGPPFTMTVWGSNRLMAHEGPYCELPNGLILHAGTTAALGVGGIQTDTCGGTGRTFSPQYCGPAVLSIRGGGACAALLQSLSGGDMGGIVCNPGAGVPFNPASIRVWIPPVPFQVVWINGGTAQTLNFGLSVGW